MLFLISPTKTMKQDGKRKPTSIPVFIEKTKIITKVIQQYTQEELQDLMKIKEPLAIQVKRQFESILFDEYGTSAIETYDGLQFKYMNISTLNESDLEYILQHVRILSGFYGIVKPMDSIYPYRLEMQTKMSVDEHKNLYEYWENVIVEEIQKEIKNHTCSYVINLASKEYDKAIRKRMSGENFIDVIFQVEKKGKRKVEATASKMARGKMIRFAAQHKIERVEQLYEFCEDGYCLDQNLTNQQQIVFYKIVE